MKEQWILKWVLQVMILVKGEANEHYDYYLDNIQLKILESIVK
jgi:hypothetical protein